MNKTFIQIDREEFLSVLEQVRPGLGVAKDPNYESTIQQSSSFVFHNKCIYTQNEYIAVKYPGIPGIVEGGLEGAVSAYELYTLLKRMPEKEVTIATTANEFIVKGKRSRAGITLQSEIKLPIDSLNEAKKWIKLPEEFINAVKFTYFSASEDSVKPELCCVHVKGNTVESCDNFRLTRMEIKSPLKFDITIPAKAIPDLIKYAPTHVAVGAAWIHFKNADKVEFSCRTISGDFPDITPYLDSAEECKIEFPKETREILNKAALFHEGCSRLAVFKYVVINLSPKGMKISAKGDSGWFEEDINCAYTGEPIEILINPEFLKEILVLNNIAFFDKIKRVLKFKGKNFVHCCSIVEPE